MIYRELYDINNILFSLTVIKELFSIEIKTYGYILKQIILKIDFIVFFLFNIL